jgi:hypothetical protein
MEEKEIDWQSRAVAAETKLLCFYKMLIRKESEPWNGPLSSIEKYILSCCK